MTTIRKSPLTWLSEAKSYFIYILLMLLFWGLVPAISKLGKMDGIQTTFWVNTIATGTLFVLVRILNTPERKSKYNKLESIDIAKMAFLGLFYPLAFSIMYFQAVYQGSPALTQIIGRTSIIMYVPILVYIFKIKGSISKQDVIFMSITVLAVLVGLAGKVNLNTGLAAVFLAFGAAFLNGVYQAVGDKWKDSYDPLIVTFVIEIVTSLVSGILIVTTDRFFIPTGMPLLYVSIIGIFANGFGFWIFLEGLHKSSKMSETVNDSSHKVIYLVSLTGVLSLIQAILISVLGAEQISASVWIGILILVAGLVWYGINKQ